MAGKKLRIGDEPVPGYRLVDFLGRGGFGEVWKAVGPGGIEVALKVIDSLAPRQGGKELRALRLLKRIRHPNLVPLIAYWLKDARGELLPDDSQDDATRGSRAGDGHGPGLTGSRSGGLTGSNSGGGARDSTLGGPSSSFPPTAAQLIIAMGLAEQSLFDRLEQCQAAGLPGIPIDELMTYLDDAARAIDLLNVQHNIQHCDIKPQNILILSGAAQVCDFGLAKAIGDMRQTSMSAGTIAYGPPELFSTQGPCPTTDQYSLAIGYYELRTGRLPFVEETITAVLEAKKTGRLDLSLVSPAEQEVLTKATSPDPADRFPTALAMVRRLRACFPEIEQLGGASGPLPRSAGSDGSAGSSANPNSPPGSPLVDTVRKSQPPLRGTLNVSDLDTQHTAPTDHRSRSDWHQATDEGTDRASKPTRKASRQSSPIGPIVVAIVLVAVGIGVWTQRDSIRRWLGGERQVADAESKSSSKSSKEDETHESAGRDSDAHVGKRPVDGAAASKPVPDRTAPDPTTTKAKTEATIPDKGKMSPDDPRKTPAQDIAKGGAKPSSVPQEVVTAYEAALKQLSTRPADAIARCSEALAILEQTPAAANDPSAVELRRKLRLVRARAGARITPPAWAQIGFDLEKLADEQAAAPKDAAPTTSRPGDDAAASGATSATDSAAMTAQVEAVLRSGLALAVDQHTAVDQRRPLEEIAQTLADFRKVDAALPSVPAGAPVDRQVDARERELFKTAFDLLRAEVRGGLSGLLAQPRRGLDIALKLQAANPDDADVAMSVADFQALAGNWPAARESLAAAVERTPDGAERDARRKRLAALDSLAQLAKPEGVELAKLLESVNTAAAARPQLSPALDLALARSLVDLVVAQPATRDVVYPVLTPALNKLLKDESTAAASGELNQRYLELRKVEREEIRKRIAAEIDRPTAPDYATVLTYCQDVERKGLADSLVRALKTECMLQTLKDGSKDVSKERLSECEREVNLFLGAPDVDVVFQPYVQYVAAMVRAAARGESLDAAADLLAGALAGNEPPRGLGSHRRDAATKLLLDAAAAQRKPADTQFVEWMKSPYKSAAAATKAQGWLQVAKRALGANQVDGTLAVALWHMTRPDPALAGNLAGQLVAAAPLNAWQRESAPLLYVDLKARRDSLDGLRAAAALVRLAHLESQANPTKAVDPLALHGELIAPLLKLAASATPSEAQRPWLAALYAAEGRLLRTHRYENWGFDDVDRKAEADYGQALLFDPQPDYYVGRGVARLRLSRSDPALLKSAEDDARAALRGDAEHAQAHALLGNIFISQSRREGNEAARTKLLEAAVAECTIAIERAGEVETERANHLINRSAAYLEWANFSFDPTLKRQAELLSRARVDADAATKLVTAYRDQAYRALGNAEEDLAWIAKQAEHWRPAVDAFSSAIDQREDLPFAWMDRGRCYYKWVVYGGADKELLDQNAAPDLQSAIRLSQVASRNELLAESHYWLGQVHAQMNRADDAAASFKAAIAVDASFHPALYLLGALNANLRKFDEADEAFGRAVKAAGDAGSVQRLAYIYSWSLTFDPFESASVDAERRKRLSAVGETLKSDLPGNSAAEVDLLAGSILELSGDREQAIARYGQGLARTEAQPQVRSLLASRRAMAYWFDVQSRYADYQKSIGKPEAAAKMQALEKAVKEARARVLPDLELARKQMQAASAIVVVDEAELAGRTAFVRQQLNRLVAGSKRFGDPDPDAIKQVVTEYSDALALKPNHPKAWGWHLNLVRAWDEQKPLAPSDPRFPAALDHLRDAIAGVTDKTEKERIDAYRETLRKRK